MKNPALITRLGDIVTSDITLRDIFAAAAIAGSVSANDSTAATRVKQAEQAYALADAMLLERGK